MHSFTPVSTVDALATSLRQTVLDGSLAPGSFLREVEIATAYGVGRQSVRAAMQQLVLEGLLRHTPNRGVQVPDFGTEDVVDIFRLRTVLESEAVRLIVSARSTPASAMDAVTRLEQLPEEATWDLVVEADMAFHRGVIMDAGSPRLARAYSGVLAEIQLCVVQQLESNYDPPSEIAAEHRELLTFLTGHNVAAAVRAFRKHCDDATENLLRTIASHNRAN